MATLGAAAFLVAAYLAGAVPWGVVLGRGFYGVDITGQGSGGTGATNVLRILGWRISAAVLVLDFAKGLLPVVIGRWLGINDWIVGAAAVATVVGHCWSPFINFKGGKGMATGGGASAGLVPWVLLVFPLMVLIVAVTRFVSLASLTAAVGVSIVAALAGVLGYVDWSRGIPIIVIATLIVVNHHGNIRRLLNGTERRFGERVQSPPASAAGAP